MSDLAGLFAQSFGFMRERSLLFAAVVIVSTVSGAAVDLVPDNFLWPTIILSSLASFLLVAMLSASALGLDPIPAVGRRLVSLVGLTVLTSVGVGLGLLLVVIPGIVMLIRWSVAMPVMLVEERGAYESLERSWKLTARRWRLATAITSVLILSFIPLILLSSFTSYPAVPIPTLLAVNFYSSAMAAFESLLCVALYLRVRGDMPDPHLPEIFS